MRRRSALSSHACASLALMVGAALAATDAVFAQQLTLVSSTSDGTKANDASSQPSISANGQFVAFVSSATNLVPGDTNGVGDVFVKDRLSGAIARVSVSTGGGEGTANSFNPRISADGRFVAFNTEAALVPEDTNVCGTPPHGCYDTYVHDRQTSTTTRISVSSTGAQANVASELLDISADGRFVLFGSFSPDLVPTNPNVEGVFLRDLQHGTTTRVSVDRQGNPLRVPFPTGRMSADARVIVYGPVPATAGGTAAGALYMYERETGVVSVVSEEFPARDLRPEYSSQSSFYMLSALSGDGRVVTLIEHVPAPPPFLISPLKEMVILPSLSRYLLFDSVTKHAVAMPWSEGSALGISVLSGLSGDGRIYTIGGTNRSVTVVDRVSGLREVIPMSQFNGFSPSSLSSDGRLIAITTSTSGVTPPPIEPWQVYVYDRDSGDGDGMPSAWETAFGLNPTNLTDANADADLDGVTNLQEFLRGTHPTAVASATRYFAEGAANAFFTTRFAAVNPGDDPAVAVFRFLGSGGATSSVMQTIAPRSRITVELPANGLAPSNDFSTVIESDRTVVVDRTMTWDSTGYGAHTETSLAAPSTTWYLAEGATHGAFDLFYLLQNANDTPAHVTINYLRQAPLTPVAKTYTVEPNSRKTIPVDAEGADLEAVDTAASFTSDLPIVVERAMYSTRAGQPPFAAGHGAAGVTAPALRWFLAEGATGEFFDLYVLVGNPNPTAANLKVTYLLPTGAPFEKLYSVGPQQRLTIYVQDEDPRLASTPVSVIVESTNEHPVVVERAMWWPKGQWHEAHVSAGATTTGTKWALADGEVTVGGDTYILIANTSTTAGTATVTLLEEGVAPVAITVDLQPSSRINVPVSQYLPASAGLPRRRFGALIETNGVEIVVERSIYATVGGITWDSGTAALGTKLQ